MMKCPHCDKELEESDVMEGLCPHCAKELDEGVKEDIIQSIDKEIEKKKKKKKITNMIVLALLAAVLVFYGLPRFIIYLGDKQKQEFDFHAFNKDLEIDLSPLLRNYSLAKYSPFTLYTARERISDTYYKAGAAVYLEGSRFRSKKHYDAFWKYFQKAEESVMTKSFVSYAAMISEHNGQYGRIIELAGKYPQYRKSMDYELATACIMLGEPLKSLSFIHQKCKATKARMICEDACFLGYEAGKLSMAEEACRLYAEIAESDLKSLEIEEAGSEEAEKLSKEIIQDDVDCARLILANVLLEQKKPDGAESLLKEVIEEKRVSTYPGAAILLSELYGAKGMREKSAAVLFEDDDALIERARESVDFHKWEPLYVERALHLFNEGKTGEAVSTLEEFYEAVQFEDPLSFSRFSDIINTAYNVPIDIMERLIEALKALESESEADLADNEKQDEPAAAGNPEEEGAVSNGAEAGLRKLLVRNLSWACQYYLSILDFEGVRRHLADLEKTGREADVFPVKYFLAVGEGNWSMAREHFKTFKEKSEETSHRTMNYEYLNLKAEVMAGGFEEAKRFFSEGTYLGAYTGVDPALLRLYVFSLPLLDKPDRLTSFLDEMKSKNVDTRFEKDEIYEALREISKNRKDRALLCLGSQDLHYGIRFMDKWYPFAVKLLEAVDPEGKEMVFLMQDETSHEIFFFKYPHSCRKLIWMQNVISLYQKGPEKEETIKIIKRHQELCRKLHQLEPFLM